MSKTITVRKGVTINTGDYNNVKFEAELITDELDWEEAWTIVKAQIEEQKMLIKAEKSVNKDLPF